jgi:hypothetical protein
MPPSSRACLIGDGTLRVSLDHLVGSGKERGRDFDADVVRRLEAQNKLKDGRLLDG